MTLTSEDTTRFWSYVDKKNPFVCWPWTYRDGDSPRMKVNGKNVSALRLMYEFHHGHPPPLGMNILRTCGAVSHDCVNPNHLEAVKRGTTFKNWWKGNVRQAKGDIEALANLVGYELVPSTNGYYTVRKENHEYVENSG